jgi:16S rRNA G966 N2-methylase RsmD
MLKVADLKPGELVLEPEAGTGAILDELPADVISACFEVNHRLNDILKQKGYHPRFNFLHTVGEPFFDAVVMNPPFEDRQYINHVYHAMDWLKPGGRIIALVPKADIIFPPFERCKVHEVEPGSGKKKGSVKVKMLEIHPKRRDNL